MTMSSQTPKIVEAELWISDLKKTYEEMCKAVEDHFISRDGDPSTHNASSNVPSKRNRDANEHAQKVIDRKQRKEFSTKEANRVKRKPKILK